MAGGKTPLAQQGWAPAKTAGEMSGLAEGKRQACAGAWIEQGGMGCLSCYGCRWPRIVIFYMKCQLNIHGKSTEKYFQDNHQDHGKYLSN
ncbi:MULTISPECIES: hypothetical protein [Pseudomonas]|uniref:Uncharacterized protein n=1 Tax=Pseudomonas sessilinigenes TaxID=658629 RepID=A0ABX8MLD6_9PSED|nr:MULTISPECIES: hypothetical protein [Pseudomonas]QXH40071.1 hypothetical protein KSS89_28295 [Pseudomonas sessilinigenes]UMZ11328.1 hypothetical protein I9018_28270 [Pseudomonas sp. MPFS]